MSPYAYAHEHDQKASPSTSTTSPIDSASKSNAPPSSRKRRASVSGSGSRGVANLTPDQLAKKRANDREAQRAVRERTKTQIEALENRIQELTSQQPYQDLQNVIRQKEIVEAENKDIKRRLIAVLNLIQPLLNCQSSGGTIRQPFKSVVQDEPCPPLHHRDAHTPHSLQSPHIDSASRIVQLTPATAIPYPEASPVHSRSSTSSVPSPTYHNPWKLPAAPVSLSSPTAFVSNNVNEAFGGRTYEEALRIPSTGKANIGFFSDGTQVFQDARRHPPALPADSHITIAAPNSELVVHTYELSEGSAPLVAHAVSVKNIPPTCPLDGLLLDFLSERKQRATEGVADSELVGPPYPNFAALQIPECVQYSHPLSRVFTDILSTFPDLSELPEQVAVLYVMFLIMRWQIAPTQENYDRLPEWVRPRPSQLLTPHPVWMDHLPWPRMRDKIIDLHHHYPFENFSISYTSTLSLNWPYEGRDVLMPSPKSNEMSINPAFERHLRDLNNWSLGPAFAKAHPALGETGRIKANVRRYV